MTDREMLELAAKAGGFGYGEWTKHGIVFAAKDAVWNPRDDDGDAFRLAVKLEMDFVWDFDRIEVYYGPEKDHVAEYFYKIPTLTDRYAATRRAITRAAAEIGRAMP